MILALFTSIAVAQPRHGDLICSVTDGSYGNQNGYTAYMDPSNPGILTTLASAPTGSFHNWVRVAPNNTDLVYTRVINKMPAPSYLVNLQPNGTRTTITSIPSIATDGFELDHDGKWVLSARIVPSVPRQNYILGVDHVSGGITTFTSLAVNTWFNEMCIDREPGAMPYVTTTCCLVGSNGPEILKSDRLGTVVTVVSGSQVEQNSAIELHPRTGDYILSYFHPINYGAVIHMSRTGGRNTLAVFHGNAIKIMQDDTAWIANGDWGIRTFLRYDLSQNAVVTIIPSGLPYGWNLTGIDVYGSRTLVCNQILPSTVTVNVQSRLPGAGGQQYALAASFARRPGLKMANGEWLHLNTASDPLFYLSALNLLPGIFTNFRGVLEPWGNNPANKPITVQIPQSLQGSGITVFVAGVIFDHTGVSQVTNTHWFVL